MHINIGMSTRGNDLNSELVKWIITQTHRTDITSALYLSRCNTSAVKAQSELFRMIRDSKRPFDYALFMDSDVCPIQDVIDILLATGKDVVTAPIWCFDDIHRDIHLNVHYTFENRLSDRVYRPKLTGIEQIQSASFSCLLVSNRVFDTFEKAKEDPILWSPILDTKWKEHENDNIFFLKLRHFGIPAYVCWDAKGGVHYRGVRLCDEVINKLKVRTMI